MGSVIKKKKKRARNEQRRRMSNKALLHGIKPTDWKDPSKFYDLGLLNYNKIPVALTEDNQCPNCTHTNNCVSIKKRIVHPWDKAAKMKVFECKCIVEMGSKFVFRPCGSLNVDEEPLTRHNLPKKMNIASYKALEEAHWDDNRCNKSSCHDSVVHTFYVEVGQKKIKKRPGRHNQHPLSNAFMRK